MIGGLDADLIMIANRIPNRGESVLASHYLEALGSKGANSAIATYRTCHKRSSQKRSSFDLEPARHDTAVVETPADDSLTVATEPLTMGDSDGDNIQAR